MLDGPDRPVQSLRSFRRAKPAGQGVQNVALVIGPKLTGRNRLGDDRVPDLDQETAQIDHLIAE